MHQSEPGHWSGWPWRTTCLSLPSPSLSSSLPPKLPGPGLHPHHLYLGLPLLSKLPLFPLFRPFSLSSLYSPFIFTFYLYYLSHVPLYLLNFLHPCPLFFSLLPLFLYIRSTSSPLSLPSLYSLLMLIFYLCHRYHVPPLLPLSPLLCPYQPLSLSLF